MEISCHCCNGLGSGNSVLMVCANMNASAATEVVPIMVKSVQPYKKEKKLPKESRKYSYTPPDSSVNDAKPARLNVPNMVITPASTHADNIQVSFKPVCAMGIIFLKTPEPI